MTWRRFPFIPDLNFKQHPSRILSLSRVKRVPSEEVRGCSEMIQRVLADKLQGGN
jgi:hypothetical protein